MNNIKLRKHVSFLLMFLFLSVTILPLISGMEKEQLHIPINEKKFSEKQNIISVNVIEDINFGLYGTCGFNIVMWISDSPLSALYRNILSMTGDINEWEQENIPDYLNIDDTIRLGNNVDHIEHDVSPSQIPVKEQIINGIIQEHKLSLGLDIYEITSAKMWGINGACVLNISGNAYYQSSGNNLYIGPTDIDSSFERAGFILSKIGYIQDMLNSSDFFGYSTYHCYWETNCHFIYMVTNPGNLMKNWSMDFGNGTSLSAVVTPLGYQHVQFTEEFIVNKSKIIASAEDLVETNFLCYKIFTIKTILYGGKERNHMQFLSSKFLEEKYHTQDSRRFERTWSLPVLDETLTLSISNIGNLGDISLNIHQQLSLTGHISWDFKWFQLRKFQTWTQVNSNIEADIQITFVGEYEWSWDQLIIERERKFFFAIGFIPVEATLGVSLTAYLDINVTAQVDITVPLGKIEGFMKAGVGWKKDNGWYPILDADVDLDTAEPNLNTQFQANVRITPSIGFQISLLFYDVAGPFIEFKPYTTFEWYPFNPESLRWHFIVGMEVNAGITFSEWMKKIFNLKPWEWPLYNFVFWECWECQAPDLYDAACTGLRMPSLGYVTEPIPINVDVLNKGEQDITVDVMVNYSYEGGQATTIDTQRVDISRGKTKTVVFEWDTSNLDYTPRLYTIEAYVHVTNGEDNDPTNNHWYETISLEVQNVRVINVLVPVEQQHVPQGYKVQINATVENNGSYNLPSILVYAYYDDIPIGDEWCDCVDIVYDLAPGNTALMEYLWDTKNVDSGSYTINARAQLLDWEIDSSDNRFDDGTVQIWHYRDLTSFPHYLSQVNSGAMVMKQMLDFLRWSSITHPQGPPSVYSEQDLYDTYRDYLVFPELYFNDNSIIDEYELAFGLNNEIRTTFPVPPEYPFCGTGFYGYFFSARGHDTALEALTSAAIWLDWDVSGMNDYSLVPKPQPGHTNHVPVAIPTGGNYDNWMVIRGIYTDEPFWDTSNPGYHLLKQDPVTIFGIWINDPSFDGIGANWYMTTQYFIDNYLVAMTLGVNEGKYVVVTDPPEGVDTEAVVAKASLVLGDQVSATPQQLWFVRSAMRLGLSGVANTVVVDLAGQALSSVYPDVITFPAGVRIVGSEYVVGFGNGMQVYLSRVDLVFTRLRIP